MKFVICLPNESLRFRYRDEYTSGEKWSRYESTRLLESLRDETNRNGESNKLNIRSTRFNSTIFLHLVERHGTLCRTGVQDDWSRSCRQRGWYTISKRDRERVHREWWVNFATWFDVFNFPPNSILSHLVENFEKSNSFETWKNC